MLEEYTQRNKHMRASHMIKEKKGLSQVTGEDARGRKRERNHTQSDINAYLEGWYIDRNLLRAPPGIKLRQWIANWIVFLEAFQSFLRSCIAPLKEDLKSDGMNFEMEAKNVIGYL